jgi:FlaA1/EpsC-like NDP-sugar epimerase
MIKGIRERGEIWISDENITRFAMPIPDAATLVLDAVDICIGGEIFVLKMKSFSLKQLVEVMRGMPFASSGFDVDVRGLIRAEKLHEDLVTSDEIGRLWESDSHYIVAPPVGDWEPGTGLTKIELNDYNSSNGSVFSNDELAQHIEECVVALGLD